MKKVSVFVANYVLVHNNKGVNTSEGKANG